MKDILVKRPGLDANLSTFDRLKLVNPSQYRSVAMVAVKSGGVFAGYYGLFQSAKMGSQLARGEKDFLNVIVGTAVGKMLSCVFHMYLPVPFICV